MLQNLAAMVLAYLIGGLMGGDLIGRLRGGVDLRGSGSGNVGASNALRTKGPGFALAVLAVDIAKGVAAALLIPRLPWTASALAPRDLALACGFFAVLGHCYPVFAHFRGGKGVATAIGAAGALLPGALPWMLGAFVLCLLLSGYAALGSLLGAACAVWWVMLTQPGGIASAAGLFVSALFLLLLFKHSQNIARLRRGTESRFERARLLGRALKLP